jgi:hypothetical protein
MDCMEVAGSIVAHTAVLGEAREIFAELKSLAPDLAVVETFRSGTDTWYAVVTTAPTDMVTVTVCKAWADGWLARHRNRIL